MKETCFPKFDKDFYAEDEIIRDLVPAFVGLSYENVNDFIAHKEGALYVENPALWRSMVSADIIRENHLRFTPGLKVGEDTVFITEYLSCAKRCAVMQECFYYLVTRETSTIFVYEKNPLSKLEGKLNLLLARNAMTERIKERRGADIGNTWKGTVVMSVIELAFLLSAKNPNLSWWKRYKMWGSYWKHPDVKGFPLKFRPSVLCVPFLFLKSHMYFLLFMAVTVLNMVGYSFNRS